MKLLRTVINENQNVSTYALTLKEIIRDNKVTNYYQILALSVLSNFFKTDIKCLSFLDMPIPYENGGTSSASIEQIRSLSTEDKVNLAQYLLELIEKTCKKESNENVQNWSTFVLRKQD